MLFTLEVKHKHFPDIYFLSHCYLPQRVMDEEWCWWLWSSQEVLYDIRARGSAVGHWLMTSSVPPVSWTRVVWATHSQTPNTHPAILVRDVRSELCSHLHSFTHKNVFTALKWKTTTMFCVFVDERECVSRSWSMMGNQRPHPPVTHDSGMRLIQMVHKHWWIHRTRFLL